MKVKRACQKRDDKKPKTVVITFRTREGREEWLKAKKARLCNNDIIESGNVSPIFIGENLIQRIRQLYYEAKKHLIT